jgi:uncharacterized protein (DUF2249 family)
MSGHVLGADGGALDRTAAHQFAAERPDTFMWTYETEGPEAWRVRIDRR